MSGSGDFNEVLELLNGRDKMRVKRRPHRLPQECYAASDCEFFFTLCARDRGVPFRDAALAQAIIEALLWTRTSHEWQLYCYCLMPDHLHFIARLPEREAALINGGARGFIQAGIVEQVRDFKKYTTRQIWRPAGGMGQLWQRSSYDRVILYGEVIDSAVDYVLENPVRKGLARQWDEYAFSGIVDDWRP